jgi:flagellar biosynthesis protein FlhG
VNSLDELDYYEVLEVPRNARPEEIARAFALVRATYDEDSLAAYSVFGPDEARQWRDRIEEAWRVLSDAESRARYDVQLGEREALAAQLEQAEGEAREAVAPGEERAPEGPEPARAPIPIEAEPAPRRELDAFDDEQDPEAPWDGARLRRSRLVRGIELDAIASVTKINPTYLQDLEEERFERLPAAVYVRGFVAAYARQLGLDGARVARSYAQRLEDHRRARPRSRLLGLR